jgi:hypothetical protein
LARPYLKKPSQKWGWWSGPEFKPSTAPSPPKKAITLVKIYSKESITDMKKL